MLVLMTLVAVLAATLALSFAIRHFKIFFLCVIFVLPFLPGWQGIALFPGAPLVNLNKIILLIVNFVWLLRKVTLRERIFVKNQWTIAIAIIFFFQVISIIPSRDRMLSFVTLAGYVGYYYLIYFVSYDTFKTSKDIHTLIKVLVFPAFIISICAIYESYTGNNLWQGQNWYQQISTKTIDIVRYGMARASAPFGNYLSLGIYLTLIWPLSIYLYQLADNHWRRTAVSVLTCICIIGVASTISRAAILSSLGILILLFFYNASPKAWLKVGAVVMALLFLIPTPVADIEEFIKIFWRDSFDPAYAANFHNRVTGANTDIEHLIHSLPIGYGVGMISKPHVTGMLQYTVHGLFLSLMLESGVIAGLAYVFLVVTSIIEFWKRSISSAEPCQKAFYLVLTFSVLGASIAVQSVSMIESFVYLFILLAAGHRLMKANGRNVIVESSVKTPDLVLVTSSVTTK